MKDSSFKKGFVIGATGSGTGKTTITLSLLACLRDMGYSVAPFKIGPDFIDPGHHAFVSGHKSYNLDSWMLPKSYNQTLFHQKIKNAEIAVVEGVMGLFDGYDGESEAGSSAQMAKWLDLPVLLVVSARGKARSAAAIVKGFESFDPDLNIAGVIFSKTGSTRHYQYLKTAVEQHCQTPCLGHVPRNDQIVMPERHLGLVTADECAMDRSTLDTLNSMIKENIDLEKLIRLLNPISVCTGKETDSFNQVVKEPPRIAVARDRAFCFYYPDNLEILEQFGATLIEFSPLNDNRLPENIDGIYFGGGYPEVFAKDLANKKDLMAQINSYSVQGMPIYGECGGFMILCRQVSDVRNSKQYNMAGCFDFTVKMSTRLRSLGYREITLKQDSIIGKKGQTIRGHEFHYSSVENQTDYYKNIYQVSSRAGQDIQLKGYMTKNTLGSYLHLHFGSNPECALQFVQMCAQYKKDRI